jgi:hypothetical protein
VLGADFIGVRREYPLRARSLERRIVRPILNWSRAHTHVGHMIDTLVDFAYRDGMLINSRLICPSVTAVR